MTVSHVERSITIRDARVTDVAAISELGGSVFKATFGHSVEPHQMQAYLDESYSVKSVNQDLEDPNKDTIVATAPDGAIVGFAVLTRESTEPCITHLQSTIELQRIYVHQDHHGKGIGSLLARRTEQIAKEQGFEFMWLGVWEENHKARRVYEKLGYAKVGDHDFVIGEIVQTDEIMLKRL